MLTLLTPDEAAAVERLRKKVYQVGRIGDEALAANDSTTAIVILLRLLDSLPAEPLYTIPGLVWEKAKCGPPGTVYANTDFGQYLTGIEAGETKVVLYYPKFAESHCYFTSLELAQAAAESDYRERMAKGLTEWKPQ